MNTILVKYPKKFQINALRTLFAKEFVKFLKAEKFFK